MIGAGVCCFCASACQAALPPDEGHGRPRARAGPHPRLAEARHPLPPKQTGGGGYGVRPDRGEAGRGMPAPCCGARLWWRAVRGGGLQPAVSTSGGNRRRQAAARSLARRASVRDARPEGRERGGPPARSPRTTKELARDAVGPAPLATAVSLPTARAARPRAAGTRPNPPFEVRPTNRGGGHALVRSSGQVNAICFALVSWPFTLVRAGYLRTIASMP
jgi:hypothetical protein